MEFNDMTDVVIASAARTPIGSFNGALSSLPASDLGKVAISAVLERATVAPAEVDEVVLGQILIAGTGQNPARQAAVAAGVPFEQTAYQINQLCGRSEEHTSELQSLMRTSYAVFCLKKT